MQDQISNSNKMPMRLLYVTPSLMRSPIGGRRQLSQLNAELLKCICDHGFEHIELDQHFGVGNLIGYLNGVTRAAIRKICGRIREKAITHVFLDGSNLGKLAEGIKDRLPSVIVVTFFHNCEARFFLGAFRQTKSLRGLAVLASNYIAERKAVIHSDKLICLSLRDSCQLKKYYGRAATHISAIALDDRYGLFADIEVEVAEGDFALFVGGAFYANQAGVEWYSREVAPKAAMHTFVLGRGMETLKRRLEGRGNITILGEVNELSPWYNNARVVVAPIFDGSGMKTKIAEALMYGKKIIGTPEAFSGYEDLVERVGWCSSTADGFIDALAEAKRKKILNFDTKLREIYLKRYSSHAAKRRLKNILNQP